MADPAATMTPPTPPPPAPEEDPRPDAELVRAVLAGEREAFAPLVIRHQPRLFALARRYARREDEVADIVQEALLKAFQRLGSYRAEAPFEHWLMRIATRTCFDFLRSHRRRREDAFTDLSPEEEDWLERFKADPEDADERAAAARALVQRLLENLPPDARLVITLLELEDRSVKEIAALTGWSVPLVKVRAFRARAAMRKALQRLKTERFL